MIFVIIGLGNNDAANIKSAIKEECGLLLDRIADKRNMDMCCYLSDPNDIVNVPDDMEKMQLAYYYNIRNARVIDIGDLANEVTITRHGSDREEILAWEKLINNGKFNSAKNDINTYLYIKQRQTGNDVHFLERFNLVYSSLLTGYMQSQAIPPEMIYDSSDMTRKASLSWTSYEGAMIWVKKSMDHLTALTSDTAKMINPIEQVREYIKQNINSAISVEDIAEKVHLNTDYLNRIFKKTMNIPISKYVIQERIETAKWYLTNTEHSATDIAHLVGYFNYSSFYRSFYKITGVSPKEWKSKHLG